MFEIHVEHIYFVFQSTFMKDNQYESFEALKDIKDMMERSARFISLSGWSGIWAGVVGLIGAYIANSWLHNLPGGYYHVLRNAPSYNTRVENYSSVSLRFMVLAIIVLAVALAGGYYFTWKKAQKKGQSLWNASGKRMMVHMAVPLLAGGVFSLVFMYHGHEMYIAPACLIFYGLALINGSKFTVSDIKYLGYTELTLGTVNLFMPGYGLTFWAIGFGAMHILYGIIMWNKYDKKAAGEIE